IHKHGEQTRSMTLLKSPADSHSMQIFNTPASPDPASVEPPTGQLLANAPGCDYAPPMHTPIYTIETCRAAFQLRWSLTVFPDVDLPPTDTWRPLLSALTENDGVRVLEGKQLANRSLVFLLSTTPAVAPPSIVKSVKGRLQALFRPELYVGFRRNFRLTSVGDANLSAVEEYVRSQLVHHHPGNEHPAWLSEFQYTFPDTELARPINSAHGQYVIAFHLVLVHDGRWRTVTSDFLHRSARALRDAATKKQHRLSTLSLLLDHLHCTLGTSYRERPDEIVVSYMNNIAFRHGMLNLWMPSYYVGTIGPYDMNAIRS
ncbi:MAG: transposase, partial [Planctomycetaceae bacterium]|nr:transposase [Planctomycetaceae bacterium]